MALATLDLHPFLIRQLSCPVLSDNGPYARDCHLFGPDGIT